MADPPTPAAAATTAKRARLDDRSSSPSSSFPVSSLLEPFLFHRHGHDAPPPPRFQVADPDCHAGLSDFFKAAGMRTALVSAPHRAVSILLHQPPSSSSAAAAASAAGEAPSDSPVAPGRDDVWLMLGVHPRQAELEAAYQRRYRHRKTALAFVQSLLQTLRPASLAAVGDFLRKKEQAILQSLGDAPAAANDGRWDEAAATALVAAVVEEVARRCPENRPEALEKEAWRQRCRHTALANALLERFLARTGLALSDVVFRPSPSPGMSRLTLTLWEPSTHQPRPPQGLLLLPAVHLVLAPPSPAPPGGEGGGGGGGAEALVQRLVARFWAHIWRYGYYPSAALREPVSRELADFFRSGLVQHGKTSVLAGFAPKRHVAIYLEGLAGAGKSSFVAKFVPALAAVVEEALDPEMDVRFVKQPLNKPLGELDRELTLRPNNNDLSVMSIIQGRRQTLQQTKPGLVVVGLEEVPPAAATTTASSSGDNGHGNGDMEESPVDPDAMEQRAALRLLADRFSGLRGSGQATSAEDRERLRRQNRAGISDHAEVLCIFTSNYPLCPVAREALKALPLFKHLISVPVAAIAAEERTAFAAGYFSEQLRAEIRRHHAAGSSDSHAASSSRSHRHDHHHQPPSPSSLQVSLEMDLGNGDIRDLVRSLRATAFAAAPRLGPVLADTGGAKEEEEQDLVVILQQRQDGVDVLLQRGVDDRQPVACLRRGRHGNNLFPLSSPPSLRDTRARDAVAGFAQRRPAAAASDAGILSSVIDEVAHALDYYFHEVLAPAVFLAACPALADDLFTAVTRAADGDVRALGPIDAATYRIVKSLYDGPEVRNLRDDIKALRRQAPRARVAVRVRATTAEAQLKLRELLEDTPSMVAFSTARSALHKQGLLFVVEVGEHITPELRSRASLVIDGL